MAKPPSNAKMKQLARYTTSNAISRRASPQPKTACLNHLEYMFVLFVCACACAVKSYMIQRETSMQCAPYQDCSYFLKTQAFCPSHWNCAIDWQRSIWHFFQLSNACQDVALSSKTLLDAAWIDAWSSARLNKRHPILAARRPEAWRTMAQSHLVWQLGLGAYDLQCRCR